VGAFVIRRTIGMVLVLIAVSFFTYLIFIKIPGGDPASRLAGRTATHANIESIRQRLGLNHSFIVQWFDMVKSLLSGSLVSYYNGGTNVVGQIRQGLPATFSLCLGAGIIWLFFGILVGTISAAAAGRFSDRAITALALIGISLPVVWLGLVLRYVFAEGGWTSSFSDGGYYPLTQNPWEWATHLILPWITLAVLFIGFYGRVLRSNILDTINEDFVRTAKAKGLSSSRIMAKHILRASLIPIVTLFGLDFAAVLGGGAIITETVYSLQGVGYYAYQSIQAQDLPALMGVTLYGAAFIVVFSVLVDVAYAYLDPRIRLT
jgi:peptide/nickel transport system permease protein